MAENLQVSGLATGLDTSGIIDSLVKVEQGRVIRAENKQKDYQLKLDKFNELKTKLQDFSTVAADLDKPKSLNLFSSTSSDTEVALVSGDSEATSGNYDVKVLSLATSLKSASKSFAAYNTAMGVAGTFNISASKSSKAADPTVTDVTVSVSATDSLKDVVNKINRAKGTGATASIFQAAPGDYRLMMTAVDEGTTAFTMENATGNPLGAAGLGLITNRVAARTEFDFRLAAGGPATTSTLIAGSALFSGLGAGTAITSGDAITWTGTDAQGAAANGSYNITGASTVQDVLTAVETAYGTNTNVAVSLSSSGEILIKDLTGGTADFVLNMSLTDTDASGSTLSLGELKATTDFSNVVASGKKAFYLLNDISISSDSNKDKESVVGTTFHLKKADVSQTVKLTLDLDKDGIQKKIQNFIDSYNSVIKFIDTNSKVEVSQDANKSGSLLDQLSGGNSKDKKQTVKKGAFANDSTFQSLRSQLQNVVSGRITELTDMGLSKYNSLASLGITASRYDGTLSIDADDLKSAIDTDFEGIKRLFLTGGYGSVAGLDYAGSTKDTKTGVYNINTATNQIDTKKTQGDVSLVTGTLSGDNNILNSNSGDSKGLGVKFDAAVPGQFTFVRGLAGQMKSWYDKATNFVDGFVTQTGKSFKTRISTQEISIDDLNKKVDSYKQRLTVQFSKLELAVSRLQSQSSAFQAQSSGFRR